MSLALAVACSFAFAFTNGFHDAANAIATLVATRGARPGQAIALSAIFNMLGAVLVGTAVADTIAGIVTVPACEGVAVIGAGALGGDPVEHRDLAARACRRAPATRSSAGWSAPPWSHGPQRHQLGRPRRLACPSASSAS